MEKIRFGMGDNDMIHPIPDASKKEPIYGTDNIVIENGTDIKIRPKVDLDKPEAEAKVWPSEKKEEGGVYTDTGKSEPISKSPKSESRPASEPISTYTSELNQERGTQTKPTSSTVTESAPKARPFDHDADVFEQMKDKIMHTPLVAKMRIFVNQKFANFYDDRATAVKNDMDRINFQKSAMEKDKARMDELAKEREQKGEPGAASFRKRIREIEEQELKMQKKYDVLNSKYIERDNQRKAFINERDAIADRLISRYDVELGPMQAEMGAVKSNKEDFLAEDNKVKHRHAEIKKELDKDQAELQRLLTENEKSPLSERQKRKNTKAYIEAHKGKAKFLAERMAKEKYIMDKKRSEIDKEVARLEAKMNPYLDKRNEFVRLKGVGRPPVIDNVPPKIKLEDKDIPRENVGHDVVDDTKAEVGPKAEKDKTLKEFLYDDAGNEYESEGGEIKSVKKIGKEESVPTKAEENKIEEGPVRPRRPKDPYHEEDRDERPVVTKTAPKNSPENGGKIEALGFKVGDLVNWTSGGSIQWEKPRAIKEISTDGEWALFAESQTGIPTVQLTKVTQDMKDILDTSIDEKKDVQPSPEIKKFSFNGRDYPDGYKFIKERMEALSRIEFGRKDTGLSEAEWKEFDDLLGKAKKDGLPEDGLDKLVRLNNKADKGINEFIKKNEIIFLSDPDISGPKRKKMINENIALFGKIEQLIDDEKDGAETDFKNRMIAGIKNKGVFNPVATIEALNKAGVDTTDFNWKKVIDSVKMYIKNKDEATLKNI